MKTNTITVDLGKLPPQAIDLEEAVLGALMLESEAFNNISLKPEYFYKDAHQKIFTAICNLKEHYQPCDTLMVQQELLKLGWFEEIGGAYSLMQLTSKVANSANIEFHAAIIHDRYISRKLISISTEISNMSFDDNNDPFDVINFLYGEIDKLNNDSEYIGDYRTIKDIVKDSMKNAEEREKLYKEGKQIGIPFPLAKLNQWTNGKLKQQLIIIAARPSMGKTAFAISSLISSAEAGHKPGLFSLEMSDTSIADRMIIGQTGINADDFKQGIIDWGTINARIGNLLSMNIIIDDKPKKINKLCSKIRRLVNKGIIDEAIIDYLQLVEDDDKNKQNREAEVSGISRKLKLLGKELDIPITALAQLNRECEKRSDKKPQMSDLRESGAIEQDADIVMFLYRPEKYGILEDSEGNSLVGKSFIIIEKQREGNIGSIPFRFNDSFTNVYDWDDYGDLRKDYNPNKNIEPNTNFDEPF